MKKQFHLTKAGVDELKAELAQLTSQRAQLAENIKTAREFGDLAENAEYQSARQEQEKAEARISEIEYVVQNVEIIKEKSNSGKVSLGSRVTLKNGATKEFQVVGTVEADPMNGKISDESPIGQALMGKKVGDQVEIITSAETLTYKIAAIA